MKTLSKTAADEKIAYQAVRSRRNTADVVIERDGRVIVRAPQSFSDERIDAMVQAKPCWPLLRIAFFFRTQSFPRILIPKPAFHSTRQFSNRALLPCRSMAARISVPAAARKVNPLNSTL